MMTTPASSRQSRNRRRGQPGRGRPARPRPAASAVSSAGSRAGDDPVAGQPPRLPVHHQVADPVLGPPQGLRQAGHRGRGDDALSVYGMIDTPYRDSSTSGTVHHRVAATTAGHHQARMRHRGAGRAQREDVEHGGQQHRDGRRAVDPAGQGHGQRRPGGGAAPGGRRGPRRPAAAGSTAASRRAGTPRTGRRAGSARRVTRRRPGPPRSASRACRCPAGSASRTVPRNAATATALIHSRCTTQGSSPAAWPAQKNGPIGNR